MWFVYIIREKHIGSVGQVIYGDAHPYAVLAAHTPEWWSPSSVLHVLQDPPSWGSLALIALMFQSQKWHLPDTWVITPRPIMALFGDLGSWRSRVKLQR